MWTKFAKSLKLASSLAAILLLPLPLANACGIYYYGEEYRVALLNPYVIGEEWSAFFHSAERINHTRYEKNGSDRRRNCAEWATHLGRGITPGEVRAVVYDASLDEFLNAVSEGSGHPHLGENLFMKALLEPQQKPLLDYLLLAKRYEHFSFLESRNPWSDAYYTDWEQNETLASQGKKSVKKEMEAQFAKQKDPFLLRRYAYQLLVMSAYDNDRPRLEELYAAHFKKEPKSVLSDWATYHRASVLPDSAEVNYLLAMSFLRCPDKRITCYQRFDKNLLDATLAFCKNDPERALVHAMCALRNPGRALSQLKKVQSFDPRCPLLPLLLVRETSKLEDWLLTDQLTGMGAAQYPHANEEDERWAWGKQRLEDYRASNKAKDRNYLLEWQQFLQQTLAAKPGALSADLLRLLAGHSFLMENQGEAAEKLLSAISKNADPKIAEQQLTERILLLLNRSDIGQATVKEQLAGLLTTLLSAKKAYKDGERDFAMLHLLLSEEYLKKGDFPTAFFLHNHALEIPTSRRYDYGTAYYDLLRFLDWQAGLKDMDAILALLEKKEKTAFEAYLASAKLPSRNALLDLRGTIAFRKNELPEALASFQKVAPDFWKTKYEFANYLVSDPFVIWSDSLGRGRFPDTKAAFVQRMMALESEAKASPAKAAENYLLLGTAWLNCTYLGKSWIMFSYGNSVNEEPGGDPEDQYVFHTYAPNSAEMRDTYYGCKRAIQYLEKARAASKDPELLARVEYLIVRQNSRSFRLSAAEQKAVDEMDWTEAAAFYAKKEMGSYTDWFSDYQATGFYREVSRHCPELMTYFGR